MLRRAAEHQPASWDLAEAQPQFYSPIPQLDDWPLSEIALAAPPSRSSRAAPIVLSQVIPQRHIERLQLSTWALLRGRPRPRSARKRRHARRKPRPELA